MVALQIRHVPDEVRDALSDEAERRGQSLQTYLLDVVIREASAAGNRQLAHRWVTQPVVPPVTVDVTQMVSHHHRQREHELSNRSDDDAS